ncbi:hypothetical protein Tco_1386923 [Tanacetum coccineum]
MEGEGQATMRLMIMMWDELGVVSGDDDSGGVVVWWMDGGSGVRMVGELWWVRWDGGWRRGWRVTRGIE